MLPDLGDWANMARLVQVAKELRNLGIDSILVRKEGQKDLSAIEFEAVVNTKTCRVVWEASNKGFWIFTLKDIKGVLLAAQTDMPNNAVFKSPLAPRMAYWDTSPLAAAVFIAKFDYSPFLVKN